MILTLTLASVLFASPARLAPAQFQRELDSHRRIHSKSSALPWTRRTLLPVLPSTCQGESRQAAEPMGGGGSEVSLRYGRSAETGFVTVRLVDLAGLLPEEVRERLEAVAFQASALKLEAYRPISRRSAGYLHAPADGTPPHAAAVVDGRFLLEVRTTNGVTPAKLRQCLRKVRWDTLRKAPRGSRGQAQAKRRR